MVDYAHPEVLVSTDWVAEHLHDPNIKLIEVDVDTTAYDSGHIPGAVGWNWQSQLNDRVRRDIPDAEAFAQLMSDAGITPKTTVVLYGDNNNWFAAFAFWLLQLYGHKAVKLMNGGRAKWSAEQRPLVTDRMPVTATSYPVPKRANLALRATRTDVERALRKDGAIGLVDVRSPAEFVGDIIAPPGMTETAQRPGHIPGARNIPWGQAVAPDGTFKGREDLERLYAQAGVLDKNEVIAYCRIGERSSHTWFALKYLLGLSKVRNYDGSWTEWGNLVGAPIVKGNE
jgi:thiosulfate/3-mercaptopyruvate sulfurtransferase